MMDARNWNVIVIQHSITNYLHVWWCFTISRKKVKYCNLLSALPFISLFMVYCEYELWLVWKKYTA